MQIINEFPPNIEEIKKVFPIRQNTVFTYGDILYNPDGCPINKALMTHEETHMKQQDKMGKELWWEKYLVDRNFRLEQELEAYVNQVKEYMKMKKKPLLRSMFIHYIASDLSSELYGNIINYKKAKNLLSQFNR